MMTKRKRELLNETNSELVKIFYGIEANQLKKLPELWGKSPQLIENQFKVEPIKIPCNILYGASRILGIERQFDQIIFELYLQSFLINNNFSEKEEGPE